MTLLKSCNKLIWQVLSLLMVLLLYPGYLSANPFVTLAPCGVLNLPEKVKPLESHINNVVVITGQGICVSENGTNRVLLLDGEGNYIDETGGTGFGLDSFLDIADLSNGYFELWVNDPLEGQINRFDRWLSPLDPIKEYKAEGIPFNLDRPVSSTRTKYGDILVLEGDKREILLLDSNLELVEKIGQYGDLETNLASPHRIASSDMGVFCITDPGQKNALLYDRFGSFQKTVHWKSDDAGPTGLVFYDQYLFLNGQKSVAMFDMNGNEIQRWSSETFNGPVYDIAVYGNKLLVASTTLLLFTISMDQ